MAVNKSIAVGVVAPAIVVGSVLLWQDYSARRFAEAIAEGDYDRAQRHAGVLALNGPGVCFLLLAGCLGLVAVGLMLQPA